MTFQSHIFILLFLPLLLAAYSVAANTRHVVTVRKWLLIAASCVFFALHGLQSVVVIALSVVVNYALYRLSVRDESEGTGTVTHLGVILNIALLAFFKFAGLLDMTRHGIVMPVALSFTTFTQIAFLLDMRSESGSAESVADSTRNIRAAYPDEGRRNCSAEPDRISLSDYLLCT